MNQALLLVVLFIAGIATLPWLVRRLQQRQGALGAGNAAARALAQVAVGPQQRVVTVEVHHEGQRTVLVLGVTAQQL
ncbi:MAG: flagellar biosynthetic protein FliO, partial [Comamonadaceae bacterium]|nr:flagellar biosynthetic protein FliO [Comamonadaceae bacterium]